VIRFILALQTSYHNFDFLHTDLPMVSIDLFR